MLTRKPENNETTGSLFFYIIKEEGNLRIEQDHHTFGPFPLRYLVRVNDRIRIRR